MEAHALKTGSDARAAPEPRFGADEYINEALCERRAVQPL